MGPELSLFGKDTWYHIEAVLPLFQNTLEEKNKKTKAQDK